MLGLALTLTSIIAVPAGVIFSKKLTPKWTNRVDPLIAGIGITVSIPFLLTNLFILNIDILGGMIAMFIGLTFFSMGTAVSADVVLYVLHPTKRAFGQALQVMAMRGLGDAGSPYIIGVLSQNLKEGINNTHPEFQVTVCWGKTTSNFTIVLS